MGKWVLLSFVVLWVSLINVTNGSTDVQSIVKFGVTVPLTGDFASSGRHIQAGVDAAVKMLRDRGKPVEVYYEDSCLPAQVMGAFTRLVTVHQIDAIVSNYCVIALPAIRGEMMKYALPVNQSAVTPPEFLANNPYLYSSFSTVESEVEEIVRHIYVDLKGRRVAILNLETPWGEGYATTLSEFFSARGGQVVSRLAQPIGQSDFRAEISKLRAASPDVIFAVHFGGIGGALIQQLRRAGMTQPIVGVQDAFDADLLVGAGNAAEKFTFFMPETAEPIVAYVDPHPLAQRAYSDTLRFAHAVQACDHERPCMRDKLTQWRREAQQVKTRFVRVVVDKGSFVRGASTR